MLRKLYNTVHLTGIFVVADLKSECIVNTLRYYICFCIDPGLFFFQSAPLCELQGADIGKWHTNQDPLTLRAVLFFNEF